MDRENEKAILLLMDGDNKKAAKNCFKLCVGRLTKSINTVALCT